MQLFYNPILTPETQFFTFDKEESKHIIRVLRKDIGDVLMVTNGNGFLFTTKISETFITFPVHDVLRDYY